MDHGSYLAAWKALFITLEKNAEGEECVKSNSWEIGLLELVCATGDERELLSRVESAAGSLGFEYFSYGVKYMTNDGKAEVKIVNNLPSAWATRYQQAGYIEIDPTVIHCERRQTSIVWSDQVFLKTPNLWREAREAGLRSGWAKSARDPSGVGSMLTLARNERALGAKELIDIESKMQWLLNACQVMLSPLLLQYNIVNCPLKRQEKILTVRETEIMKWTAEGKTSSSISDTLHISEATVNFHIKNVLTKLNASNKTAAAVQAVRLGLLD